MPDLRKKTNKKNILKQFVENQKYQVRCTNIEPVQNKIVAHMHTFLEISEDSKYDDVEISDKKHTQNYNLWVNRPLRIEP